MPPLVGTMFAANGNILTMANSKPNMKMMSMGTAINES
jgi:hypothetical protein